MKIKTRLRRLKKSIKEAPLSAYVVLSLAMITIFTIVMIVIFCMYQTVPDTLITCYFACWGGEVLVSALIKIFKLKENDYEREVDE